MAEAARVRLGEVVDLLAGYPFKSERFSSRESDIALVKGENLLQGYIDWEIAKRWPADEWASLVKFHLAVDDVVVAMDRPWVPAGLKWASIRHKAPRALLVQRCARLRSSSPRLDQRFLRFVIGGSGFESYVRPITTGVNVPHISGKQILDFECWLPSPDTQRRIASILSAYDDLIENCQRRIRILEDMARRLYLEWFVHFRFPGADSLPRVDSPLGPIPQGWLGRFADLATIARGTINPAGHADEEFVHFSLPAFDDGQRAVVESGASILSNKTLVPVPCTLLSKLNPRIPRVWRVSTATLRRAIASTEFLALVANDANTSDFVHATCTSKLFQDRLATLAIGTSTSHQRVKPDSLLDMAVVVPTLAVRRRFAESIRPNLDLAEVLRSKITNLRRTRDVLLPRLMSGQIDLSSLDPNGDSAVPAPAPSLV